MCEIICINYDKGNAKDPDKDKMCYKKGMVICVQDDGWAWSATELSDSYKIIKLPGVPKEKVQKWLEPERGDTVIDEESGEKEIVRRRHYKLDLTKWAKADDDAAKSEAKTDDEKVAVLAAKEVDLKATITDKDAGK